MPQIVKIDQFVKQSKTRQPDIMRTILEGVARFKERRTYGVIMHGYDLNDEEVRAGMFETLIDLRKYCIQWGYPMFHMMLVDGGSRLPKLQNLFTKIYGTDDCYEEWAERQVSFAEFMLQSGLIVLQ